MTFPRSIEEKVADAEARRRTPEPTCCRGCACIEIVEDGGFEGNGVIVDWDKDDCERCPYCCRSLPECELA